MIDLKTGSRDRGWLPSFDLHEEDGELVLHADLRGLNEEVEVSVDGRDLVLQLGGGGDARHGHLLLPFPPPGRPAVRRPSAEVLEVRIRIPPEPGAER